MERKKIEFKNLKSELGRKERKRKTRKEYRKAKTEA
jgi:hypothetical protein